MEQSPCWEANTQADSQEILHMFWNVKVHYRVHKDTPLLTIVRQMHPVPNLQHFP
jgi:hypothetical protein